nr:MAG TPA: hypothetical protein [Caudoviricetes sp.]
MITLNNINLSSIDLSGIDLRGIKLGLGGRGGGSGDGFPQLPGDVTRWHFGGLTNEMMAAMDDPRIEDADGKGRFLSFKNFAWGGMSGVNGYVQNFNNFKNNATVDKVRIDEQSSNSIKATILTTGISNAIYIPKNIYQFNKSYSIKISSEGYNEGDLSLSFYASSVSTATTVKVPLNSNGITEIPAIKEDDFLAVYINVSGKVGSFTVEQLPLYPGALVFDGVDDYGVCENFPILTKEKGYTVVALRQWITRGEIAQGLVSNVKNWLKDGAFLLEYRNIQADHLNKPISFGAIGSENDLPHILTYQTSKSYNGVSITTGNFEGTDVLHVGKLAPTNVGTCINAAIWELVFLDHDATEEELTKIKDYFVKTYPWLFPDQAWTVTGKTNEDEDRATIANITGNGNDLVLSNFGFAEGSGYGLYKTPFELYPSVQHSSKYSLSFSKFALGDHNLIIAPKQNDLSYDIKVKVTGLKDGVKFKWGWIGTTGYIDITTDGIHMLNKPASQIRQLIVEFAEDFDPDHVVTIEQIPEYEGYLITDGVDDKVKSVNAVTLNKDFTVVGEWRFKETEIRSNCGIVVERVLFVYNIPTGIRIYIHEVGGNFTELQNIKSLKAICSNGIVYDENWNPISVKVGSLEEYSNKLLLGYLSNLFTQIAFKNMSIYSNQVLSKDDCIKAYNYLQTLK